MPPGTIDTSEYDTLQEQTSDFEEQVEADEALPLQQNPATTRDVTVPPAVEAPELPWRVNDTCLCLYTDARMVS